MENAREARIEMYFHCKTCLKIEDDINGKLTATDYGEKLAVGWTKEGVQVVCENCGNSIIDLDFDGQKVKAFKK